jgi:hypothetical protein
MGAIANCCSRQSIIQSSSISIYSMSESEQLNTNDLYKDLIPTILDVNHALNFTTSKEYYTLLLKNIPKHIISKKICNKLNNSEIITLIYKLLDWIISENIDDCDESTKQKINLIKENSKNGLKYVLKELKDVKFGEILDIYILQALTSTSLISQCVLFLKSQNNPSNSEDFRLSFWGKDNIVNVAKNYIFQAAYFLLLTKNKYSNKAGDNSKVGNKITNELKEQINKYCKISIDFTNDIINS